MPPTPKEPSLRARRNKTATRATLTAQSRPKVPPLPTGIRWSKHVTDWWKRAHSSPMAPEWTDADVDALYMAARLMQMLWSPETTPNVAKGLSGEIRQILAQCGLTPMSRRSLQWEIDRGEAAAASTENRRATKATPAKKAAAKPDPRAARANLHAV